ncbi:ABC transporter permease [Nocardioides dongxiaopingii]|uniref:ABC transporter permease n=1 Tax=Nocardioides TaxID=1839 RepID=UPI0010C76CFC|nr:MULTISPECIES: ABC transporter permease [Nocardioides]QCW49644.1 ABC transporter permease [Nocardioides sp. S-1144]
MSTLEKTPPPAPATRRGPDLAKVAGDLLRSRELAVLVVLLLLVAVATVKSDGFLSGDSWRDLLLTPSILLLLAAGQMLVIITRNVDLSVGSTLGITAYAAGDLMSSGSSPWVAALGAVALGALLGAVNGVIIAFGRVPALVITLGTMLVFRGILLHWAGSDRVNAGEMDAGFLDLGTAQVLTIPVLTIISLVVVVAVGYYLRTTRGGRELYAIGSDPDAAALFGLPIRRRVLGAFIASGALAGLAGVFWATRYGGVSSNAGEGIELQAVAAAVIGGVAIFGGSGSVWGAAIGAFLLVTIDRVLPILGVPDFYQQAVVGALIIGAIVLDRVLASRAERRLAVEREVAP